jgi:two-component sensor histidine kinase
VIAELTQFEAYQSSARDVLRESHHRITNHLTLLVSMIRTQNAAIKKGPATLTREDASGVLNEISANVVAMAQLHRHFVKHPGSPTVDLADLLIESCSEMMVSLSLKDRVRFRHTLRSVCEITADEATSINLLLSEIVMNAIKYAHPDGSPVEIDVSCRLTADGHPAVDISDDGSGLPTGFDELRHGGTGFRIIRTLARKLHANLTVESGQFGLRFHLLLPARVSRTTLEESMRATG